MLDTGMIFNDTRFQKQSIPVNNLTIRTKTSQIDTTGVNDIYDAVGWGARSDKMWQKIKPFTTYAIEVLHNKKVVGFARLVDDGKNGMVYDVCVLPAYQKQKVGSLIMAHVSNYIHQHQLTFAGLVVVHENPSAKRFYEKFGFNPVSRILQLYRDNIQLYRDN